MTPLSRHLDDEQAQRLVEGSLSRDEALAITRHVAVCAECRASVEAYRTLAGALDALGVPEVPPDFTSGVLSRIDAHERAAARERRWALGIVSAMLVAAIAALGAAGPSAWAPALSYAADTVGSAARALHVGASFLPAVIGALRFQIAAAAALLALPLVVALARLVPAPRPEIV